MDAHTLRSLQGPLKDRYRQAPEAARVTLRAEGRVGEGVTCNVATAHAIMEAGLQPAASARSRSREG